MELILIKTADGSLRGADEASDAYLAKLRRGDIVRGKFTKPNNPQFHRKLMALFRLLFEQFEGRYGDSIQHRGEVVKPNFERFREDLTIVAGFYDKTFNLNGELRLTAKSLSFASMEPEERERVYSAVINAGLSRVLDRNWNEAKLRDAVDKILAFD